eukprot:623951-Prymnesium_polylepis.1
MSRAILALVVSANQRLLGVGLESLRNESYTSLVAGKMSARAMGRMVMCGFAATMPTTWCEVSTIIGPRR